MEPNGLNKENTGLYVYEGHNTHTVSVNPGPKIDLDTLKKLSTVTIPDNLFVITLSEQNKSTMMERSDIITLLAFSNKIYENDPIFNNFEYKEDKFHVNYLNVIYFKISILLNFYQNLTNLKFYGEAILNNPNFPNNNKIVQLLNTPIFKEKIIEFYTKKYLFYNMDQFYEKLNMAKDYLTGTNIIKKEYFQNKFNKEIFERNKHHIIFFITELLLVNNEKFHLFPFFLFIIDDYLIKKYNDGGLKDFSIGNPRIEIELSKLSFLANKFLEIGNFDIKFYSPGDICRNIGFTNQNLSKVIDKFIYFEEEKSGISMEAGTKLFPDFYQNFETEREKYIKNIIYLKKNDKIYRYSQSELVEIKPYFEYHDFYKKLKNILPDAPSTLTFKSYETILDGKDYGTLYHLEIKNLYIYGVMKFDDYISMKDTSSTEDSNFKIPNITGINLVDNLSESKFSKENKLLNKSQISFSEMYDNILKINDGKPFKILLITGCGNYDYNLKNYYDQLDNDREYYKKYIDNLGRVREPFLFEIVLEEIRKIHKKIKEIEKKEKELLNELSELKKKKDSVRDISIIESKIMGLNKNKTELEKEIKLLEENKTMPYTGLKKGRGGAYFKYIKYKKKYLNLKNKIIF